MINDWYQAILDIDAQPDQSKELAIRVSSLLASKKIITLYKPTQLKTHISGKFAPGPEFSYASGSAMSSRGYQDLNIGGMDVYVKNWVNEYGIIGLEHVSCPVCRANYTRENFDQLSLMREAFIEASARFISEEGQPRVTCISCRTSSHARQWKTEPHLGFCHLAFIFWNWPPFDSWNLNIPALISEVLGKEVVVTYGRL